MVTCQPLAPALVQPICMGIFYGQPVQISLHSPTTSVPHYTMHTVLRSSRSTRETDQLCTGQGTRGSWVQTSSSYSSQSCAFWRHTSLEASELYERTSLFHCELLPQTRPGHLTAPPNGTTASALKMTGLPQATTRASMTALEPTFQSRSVLNLAPTSTGEVFAMSKANEMLPPASNRSRLANVS